MKIISERQYHDVVSFYLFFACLETEGAGFSFDCDEKGTVDIEALKDKPCAYKNYLACLNGERVKAPTIETSRHKWTEAAVGECVDCGAEVYLDRFTNTCDCGADYNMSGQLLAPREQWCDGTDDHLADVLRIR